jgi:hypothetical protein
MHTSALQALDRVTLKAEYFVDIQLWPVVEEFDPLGWLNNFTTEDRPLAALLLDSFVYLPSRIESAMFLAAVHGISGRLQQTTRAKSKDTWRTFIQGAIFCMVTGESPNPSDSGYIFARRARQILGIDESRLTEPGKCLEVLHRHGPRPVVFVDDFVGSGEQFIRTWRRSYMVAGENLSFRQLATRASNPISTFYCPILTTARGVKAIAANCPQVMMHPAHILDPETSPLHPQTAVFPDALRASGQEMIRRVSAALGIPDTDGSVTNDWQGYRKLGTSIAFSHGLPDATLPLFYWDAAGWTPLKRRT